ncbi:hypothetical protein M758_3G134800 [Ceratodon purpureus]|nr:hypothetical protein M758_3G134800 [Ceratodon purpureus]
MAIPAPVPTPVALPESLPHDHANSSVATGMELDVRGEDQPGIHMLEARAEDGHEPVMKKIKRVHGEVEMVLRQTAEIVMVLVGVAALRGGAQPSPLECQLAAQAYEKLATLVTVSAPQDLVSKDALQSLIQQLTVPPPPPTRPATKPVAIQSPTPPLAATTQSPASAPLPSPSLSKAAAQAQALASTPSPSSSPSISPSPSPAPLFSSLSSASAPPDSVASSARASELGPAVIPAPAPKATTSASKAVIAASKTGASAPSPALGKAKPLDQVQTSSSSLDGVAPSVTPSPAPATNANVPDTTPSSAPATDINVPVATSTTPANALRTKSGGRTSPVKQQATPSADAQPTTTVTIRDQRGSQAPKALARQRGLKNMVPEQPVPPDPLETHRQITLAVQLLLKPYIITTALSKTAGNYMSTPIPCGICKVVVNTTNNVLVCDGCECGFHLQCLQLSSTTSIPKGDWYCPKCVTTNAGRPQPPKYGPLRRGPAGQSGPKNSWSMQAGRGSDASKGQSPGKLLLQSKRKEVDAVQDSVEPPTPAPGAYTNSQHEAVARRHSMEEYARGRAQIASKQISAGVPEQEVSEQSLKLEWLGPVVSSGQEQLYYSACSVGGVTIRLQDAAFFRPEAPDVPPYIARLQALWEDKSSGQKWVKVNWCYYPSDLPVNMGRPVTSDPREVYESNHSDNNLVGSIQGPCLVLSPLKYQEELDRRSKNPKEDPVPLFLCQWFYDAPKGLFRASDAPS